VTDSMVFINGRPEACVDPRDRGFCYGHGVFETMKLSAGQVPLWKFHRRRLLHGLAVIGICADATELELELQQVLTKIPDAGTLKLVVTAGAGSRGYRAIAPLKATTIFQWFPHSVQVEPAPVSLQVCQYSLPHNPYLAGIKHLNRLDQVLAAQELEAEDQGLLLDVNGAVIEALSHNLFIRRGEHWMTPRLDHCGVAGVMRAVLMEKVFPRLSLNVTEAYVELFELLTADEIFICNAVAGIQAVATVKTLLKAEEKNWRCHGETRRIRACLEEIYPCFTA